MKADGVVADGSLGPPLGEPAVWDMDSPDHECDCPGPPPHFHVPPPPRPSSVIDFDCSENLISDLEICETVPVIDAEYHFSPAIPSLAVILMITIAVVVFLFIGILLVLLKKKRTPNSFPRKSSSPQNHCDAATANGVIYEDLTNVRLRTLTPHLTPCQTMPPITEMMDVSSYPNPTMFTQVCICPTSPLPDSSYDSKDLFNPVYEELSNGSGERGETDSEGMPRAPASEDEFAEDELSLGGEDIPCSSLQGSVGNELCRDLDSSDADDRSKFLKDAEKNFSLPSENRNKGRRMLRGKHFETALNRPRTMDRRKVWKSQTPSSLFTAPSDCTEFHEDLLLKKILQTCSQGTGFGTSYLSRCGSPCFQGSPPGAGQYQSLAALGQAHPRRQKPEIFTTYKAILGSSKNQNQDSPGSDSGFSNNTSGGNPPSKGGKDCELTNNGDPVLS